MPADHDPVQDTSTPLEGTRAHDWGPRDEGIAYCQVCGYADSIVVEHACSGQRGVRLPEGTDTREALNEAHHVMQSVAGRLRVSNREVNGADADALSAACATIRAALAASPSQDRDATIREVAAEVVCAVLGEDPPLPKGYNDGIRRTAEDALRRRWPALSHDSGGGERDGASSDVERCPSCATPLTEPYDAAEEEGCCEVCPLLRPAAPSPTGDRERIAAWLRDDHEATEFAYQATHERWGTTPAGLSTALRAVADNLPPALPSSGDREREAQWIAGPMLSSAMVRRINDLADLSVAVGNLRSWLRSGDGCFLDNMKPDELREAVRVLTVGHGVEPGAARAVAWLASPASSSPTGGEPKRDGLAQRVFAAWEPLCAAEVSGNLPERELGQVRDSMRLLVALDADLRGVPPRAGSSDETEHHESIRYVRSLMCSPLGREIAEERCIRPFGYVIAAPTGGEPDAREHARLLEQWKAACDVADHLSATAVLLAQQIASRASLIQHKPSESEPRVWRASVLGWDARGAGPTQDAARDRLAAKILAAARDTASPAAPPAGEGDTRVAHATYQHVLDLLHRVWREPASPELTAAIERTLVEHGVILPGSRSGGEGDDALTVRDARLVLGALVAAADANSSDELDDGDLDGAIGRLRTIAQIGGRR